MIPEIRNEFIYGKASKFDDNHEVVGISQESSKWCTGALAHNFSIDVSTQIFDSMEAFAKYSFNKSHAFCYAVISYKTAYLSLYYPVEFAVANCTVNEEEEKIVATLSLAKKRKIPILPPDINKSKTDFSHEWVGVKECVRYGLKAIKGVGAKVVEFLSKYQKMTNITFADFDDYYKKVHADDIYVNNLLADLRQQTGKNSPNPMKKDVEEALILAGAFDFCNPNRYDLWNHYIHNIKKEPTGRTIELGGVHITPTKKDYNKKAKLSLEKKYMGAYISEHPLDSFSYADFESAAEGEMIKTTGLVVSATLKDTKRKKKFLSIQVVDKTDSQFTINVFNESLAISLKNDIKKNNILIIEGTVSHKFHNINAKTAKIAIKQTVITEDIVVEEKFKNEYEYELGIKDTFDMYLAEDPEDPLLSIFGKIN